MAAWPTVVSGPNSATGCPTGSASTPKEPCGTPMCRTSTASAYANVATSSTQSTSTVGGFACALGGPDRQTLYIVATEWNGPENMFKGERTGQLLTVAAPAPAAGWPGR
jgi:hypothetical protein